MTQYLPADDDFTLNNAHWSPSHYLRVEPTQDTTVSIDGGNYIIGHEPGQLFDFYQGFGFGEAAMVGDATQVYRAASMVTHRATWRSAVRVQLDARLKLIQGAVTNDHDVTFYGVWARVRGGTMQSANTRDEYLQDVTAYGFGIMTRLNTGQKLALIRLDSGTVNILEEADLPQLWDGADEALFGKYGPTRIALEVTTVSGDPVLKGYVETHRTLPPGTVPPQPFPSNEHLQLQHTDTDANKIALPGRCGFSLQHFGDSVLDNRVGVVASSFKIEDITLENAPVLFLEDEFRRRDRRAARTVTDDESNQGYSLMSRYTGDSQSADDHYGQLLTHTSDDAKLGDNLPTGSFGWHIHQRVAPSPDQHRSMDVNLVNFAAVDAEFGLVQRFTPTHNPTSYGGSSDAGKKCYAAVVVYDGGTGDRTLELRWYPGNGTHTVLADKDLAGIVTYGTQFSLDFECQNQDAQTTRPAMRVKIDGTPITGWANEITGITIATSEDWILDDRTPGSQTILLGEGEGFFFSTSAAQASEMVELDNWDVETLSDISDVGGNTGDDDSDYASVAVATEIDGAFGTLSTDLSWVVTEDRIFTQLRNELRAGHTDLLPKARRARRVWQLRKLGATIAETRSIEEFVNAHRGAEKPFQWEEPGGTTVFVRMAGDLRTTNQAPNVYAVQLELVELFSPYDFTFPEASFDLFAPITGGGGTTYYQGHVQAGDSNLTITVNLSGSGAGIDDTLVAYEILGDAIEGTDFTVVSGSSPLTYAEGDTSKTIELSFPAQTKWFLERSIIIKLKAEDSAFVTPDGLADEFRVFVRPTASPPVLDFVSASSSPGSDGFFQISTTSVGATTTTREKIFVYFEVTGGTAVEGTDYNLLPGSLSGERAIDVPGGQTNATIVIEVLTQGSGKTIDLSIHHEANGGGDENRYTFSEDGRCELFAHPSEQDDIWPGDWTDLEDCLLPYATSKIQGPDPLNEPGHPLANTPFIDPFVTHPRDPSRKMWGFYVTEGGLGSGYVRHSFENEVSCDGPEELIPFENYQRWSVYVELPSGGSAAAAGPGRFVLMNFRNRLTDTNHRVVFDRESPDGGLLGAAVSTPSGEWGVYTAENWNAGSAYGVDTETVNGRVITRLWIMHNADAGEVGDPSARIIYPTYFGKGTPIRESVTGEPDAQSAHVREGLLFYDWYLEFSSTALSGSPGEYWPKRRLWWEPRGNAQQGTTQLTHTVTL